MRILKIKTFNAEVDESVVHRGHSARSGRTWL